MARIDQIYRDGFPVTAADADLASRCDGLFVSGTGDVVVTSEGGHKLTFSAVPAASIIPMSIIRVWAATTATSLIGLQYIPDYGRAEEDIVSSIADELTDDTAAAIYDDAGQNIYV